MDRRAVVHRRRPRRVPHVVIRDEMGYPTFPDTWKKPQEAGKKFKTKGMPIGQALSHSFGDPPGFWYPWLWSFGGKEVELMARPTR